MRKSGWRIGIIMAALALALFLTLALVLVRGSTSGPPTDYGSPLGKSINGTGAFVALLKREGHQIRIADNLTEELQSWAQVIVRFAWCSGPPPADEARWYDEWLQADPERKLLYVVHDYEAEEEYWSMVLKQLKGTDETLRKEAQSRRDAARNWAAALPEKAAKPATGATWFAVGKPVVPPKASQTLAGPWADGIDAQAAELVVHEPLTSDRADVLLSGEGKSLVLEWQRYGGGSVLAVANGSFLLNLALVNPARRPLAALAAAWVGEPSRRIAFVDGPSVLGTRQTLPTLLDLIARISSFRWVAVHFGLFGLLACLAHAPRLGRSLPAPLSDADGPAAHAEAVGDLLARSQDAKAARDLLETYRRWRSPRLPQPSRRSQGKR